MVGESENRTDFGEGAVSWDCEFLSDFLRKEDEDPMGGLSEARAKSLASDGSFGCVMVEELSSALVPRNWEIRALYCVCRLCSVSWSVRDALYSDVNP